MSDDTARQGGTGGHLDEALKDAAGRRIEDQGLEGGLTEATHGAGERRPERREGTGQGEAGRD